MVKKSPEGTSKGSGQTALMRSLSLCLSHKSRCWKSHAMAHFIYSYWDSSFDDELLENKVAMNLLYVQVRNSLSLFMGAQ